MKLDRFRVMVRRMAEEVPSEYLDGIASIDVSRRTLPHPVHANVYTLGECVPIHGDADEVLSRVVLYHGSFLALAHERDDFDWQQEAWDTLLHELRHHVEWRADAERLEVYDWAAEQGFARAEGRPYDPLFYEAGEAVAAGVYRVEDDVFIDRVVTRLPQETEVEWHGGRYRVPVPSATLPMYLTLDGLAHPPSGDVVLAFRRRPRLWDLFRRSPPVTEHRAEVEAVG
ncbi:MAG: metallopeptidase family protein [Gemmatimonadales bacterium]|jgi:hypothetical protein